jgi:DNA primase
MSIETGVIDIAHHFLTGIKRSGPENIMAICPFHVKADGSPETVPSFAISLTTGLWMCHACHEKGNLRTLLRAIGVPARTIDTFYKPLIEAVEAQAGKQYKKQKNRVYNDCSNQVLDESILGLFEFCPTALLEEGFSEETIKHFDVGFDQKNARITFPLRDILGRLVGISGRTVQDDPAKYKVYSYAEYTAWGINPITTDKSLLLWNIDKVYPEVIFCNPPPSIIVVEGFKACMWLWQAGLKNVVALMGSFLSPYQEAILDRIGGEIYLFLDTNMAGQKGTMQAGLRLCKKHPVKVVQYSEPQPTDISPDQLKETVSRAVDFIAWGYTR